MARSFFQPAFFTPRIGASTSKSLIQQATGFIPGSPTATTAPPLQAPVEENTILGMPPLAALLGGTAILGTIVALALGHK